MLEFYLPQLLAEFLIKSGVCIALGFLVLALAHRLAPQFKHLFWIAILSASLLIPILLALPRWEVLPRFLNSDLTALVIPDGSNKDRVLPGPSEPLTVAPGPPAENSPSVTKTGAQAAIWPWVLTGIWVAGVVLLVLRSFAAGILLRRIVRHSVAAPARIASAFNHQHEQCCHRRPVALSISRLAVSPFTWGIFRSHVVLPTTASEWSEDELNMILVHEFAHIYRRDALAVLLSRIFLILNWVNPMAWLALRQTGVFREETCDSLVLARGYDSRHYAEALFHQAKVKTAPLLKHSATAVAESGTVENRIKKILKHNTTMKTNHHSNSFTASFLPRTLAASLALAVAGIGLTGWIQSGPGDEPSADAEPSETDEFAKLYEMRIELFSKWLEIYDPIKDDASAEKAAKEWRALLPLERSIKEFTEKLGQPTKERYEAMQAEYGEKLNDVSIRATQKAYALANKPYFRKVQVAQLRNQADLGNADAAEALKFLQGGEPAPAAPVEVNAADPKVREAIEGSIKATKDLNTLLADVNDADGAVAAEAEAAALVKKWQASLKALNDLGPDAGDAIARNQEALKAPMAALVQSVIRLNQDPKVSEPLNGVLMQIMAALSGV